MAIVGLVLGIVVGLLWIGFFTWGFIEGFSHSLPFTGEALFDIHVRIICRITMLTIAVKIFESFKIMPIIKGAFRVTKTSILSSWNNVHYLLLFLG